MLSVPLAICEANMTITNTARSVIADLTKRNTKLTKVLVVENISEDSKKALANMGISVEEVKQ